MARLSQAFLSNLGRPAMTQSLFDLGTAIGNVPNQYQEKKKRDADAAELATATTQPERMRILASQLERDGKTAQAQEVRLKARALERQGDVEKQQDELFGQQQTRFEQEQEDREFKKAERVATVKGMLSALEGSLSNETLSAELREEGMTLLQDVARSGESAIAMSEAVRDFLGRARKKDYDIVGNYVYKDGELLRPSTDYEKLKADLTKTGKFDPKSIEDAFADGGFDASKINAIAEKEKPGRLSGPAEKELISMNEQASKAQVAMQRNLSLSGRLASNPNYYSGVISDIRTEVLGIAGLRDATEEEKTAFLRQKNNELINGLPPGASTDRDVVVFGQGLPPDNAPKKEIMSYLAGERKVLAMTQDMAVLADQHLGEQMGAGREATMVGLARRKLAYKKFVERARGMVESIDPETRDDALNALKKRAVVELGFVPAYLEAL